jgi:hypothetical protein
MPWASARRAGGHIRAGRAGAIAVLLHVIGVPLGAQTPRAAEWKWAGIVPVGQTITIDAVHADVRVLPSRGEVVEVSAVLLGRKDAPESVTMVVDTVGEGVVIRTRYPSYRARRLDRRDECLPPDTVHGHFWYSDVHAELAVRVPRGVRVAIRLMRGNIDARAVTNPMQLATQNGVVLRQSGHHGVRPAP